MLRIVSANQGPSLWAGTRTVTSDDVVAKVEGVSSAGFKSDCSEGPVLCKTDAFLLDDLLRVEHFNSIGVDLVGSNLTVNLGTSHLLNLNRPGQCSVDE